VERDHIRDVIAKNIAKLVNQQSLTNIAFAKRCKISTGMANKILNAKVSITVATLYNIADGLGVSLKVILKGIAVDHADEPEIAIDTASIYCGILSMGDRRLCAVTSEVQKSEFASMKEFDGSIVLTDSPSVIIQTIKRSVNSLLGGTVKDFKKVNVAVVAHCYELEEALRKLVLSAQKHFANIAVFPDWKATYRAAFGKQDGISLVVDKGVSISYQHGDEIKKYGGWGFPIYDLGGEYWLGMVSVRHTIQVVEGFDEKSLLSREILAKFGGKLETLIEECIRNNRNPDIYSNFCDMLLHAYANGCPKAQSILDEGYSYIGRALDAIDGKVGQQNKISINGSLAGVYGRYIGKARVLDPVDDEVKLMLLCDIAREM
jgi:N-acetylglucosamine kinase-like BadF-type ATPase/transcriptional regulator with XRE-family HTH domain